MNRLSREKQKRCIHALLEGCSIRSTERLTGVHRDTICRLLLRTGQHCDRLLEQHIQGFEPSLLQVDEAWTYVGKHDKRLRGAELLDPEIGSQFVFLALDDKTKLIPAHAVGKRSTDSASTLMLNLRRRIVGRPKIVTDAFGSYIPAVELAFGANADFSMLVKVVKNDSTPVREAYAAAHHVVRCDDVSIQGHIDPERVSTSFIERKNASLRLFVKRLNRLTLAYSKRLSHLRAAISLWVCWYNFGHQHRSLSGATPAIAAGVSRRFWTVGDLLPEW